MARPGIFLKAAGVRRDGPELISWPHLWTNRNATIIALAQRGGERLNNSGQAHQRVAVMGCVVMVPGRRPLRPRRCRASRRGCGGGPSSLRGEIVKKGFQDKLVDELFKLSKRCERSGEDLLKQKRKMFFSSFFCSVFFSRRLHPAPAVDTHPPRPAANRIRPELPRESTPLNWRELTSGLLCWILPAVKKGYPFWSTP